jgi:hypothetical protein
MFRSFISDGKIVYFRGVFLIWSYFSQNRKAHFSLERVNEVIGCSNLTFETCFALNKPSSSCSRNLFRFPKFKQMFL